MKVTIENEGVTATIADDSVTADAALDAAVRCIIAVGFQAENIHEAIIEMGRDVE